MGEGFESWPGQSVEAGEKKGITEVRVADSWKVQKILPFTLAGVTWSLILKTLNRSKH